MPHRKNINSDDVLKELRAFGLAYPGAHLKSPWPGHMDLAVKDKTFAYLSVEGEPFSIACKLPQSNVTALALSFTRPTEYGLGKSGWVSAVFAEGDPLPIDMLKEWIDESYRAQAPKKLLATLNATTTTTTRTSTSTSTSTSTRTHTRTSASTPAQKTARTSRVTARAS